MISNVHKFLRWDKTLTAVADHKLQITLVVVESLKTIVWQWNGINIYLILFIVSYLNFHQQFLD